MDEYYAGILGITLECSYALDLDALQLPSMDLLHLELSFSCEEVEHIVKSMSSNKASGRTTSRVDSIAYVGTS